MSLNDYETDIVCSIQICYAETLYKIYADFTHNADNKYINKQRTNLQKKKFFRYIQIEYNTLDNKKECEVNYISPIPLTLEMREELYKKIIDTNEEYIKGFKSFLYYTEGKWFEPLESISVNQILHITKPLQMSSDLKSVSFQFCHVKHYKGYSCGWRNIPFYHYLYHNPYFLDYLYTLRKEEIEYYKKEVEELKKKFSFYLEFYEFHEVQGKIYWIEKHLSLLENNRYNTIPTSYTFNDDYTIGRLIRFGIDVNRKNDFLFQLFGDS